MFRRIAPPTVATPRRASTTPAVPSAFAMPAAPRGPVKLTSAGDRGSQSIGIRVPSGVGASCPGALASRDSPDGMV